MLFEIFDEGLIIYDQIRDIELENHGAEILNIVDADIACGRIKKYTYQELKQLGVHKIFDNYFKENKYLYGPGDLGEVYAISLAQTLGAYSLITDDIKQGGPYMSLLQFDDEVTPFTFVDVLLLRYLLGSSDEVSTVKDYDEINITSDLNWSLTSHLSRFIKRFWKDPYKQSDKEWINGLLKKNGVNAKEKLYKLYSVISSRK